MQYGKTLLTAAVALPILTASAANAVVFTGTATGSWGSAVAGPDNPSPDTTTNNDDGATVATFTFGTGTPDPVLNTNVFTFDGAGSNAGSAVAGFTGVTPGQLFDIGQFTYFNGTTVEGTAVDSVVLSLSLNLTDPSDASPNPTGYNYSFSIDLTSNTTGDPVLDGDIVSIINGITATTFTAGGITYTLALEGFSTDGGNTFTTQFLSPEGSTAIADIYAIINQPSLLPVPEPASLTLLGTALVGLGAIRRRRRRTAA